MEIILEGIEFSTIKDIFENHKKNVKGLYLDNNSDLYNIYLRDVTNIKISEGYSEGYTVLVFKNCLPIKKIRNNEYVRIVIQ